MKWPTLVALCLLATGCDDTKIANIFGRSNPSSSHDSIESLVNAPRTPMPPICRDAMENRFDPSTMVGQSTDKDVGGVGFTGHTSAELALGEAFNTEISRINRMVAAIRGNAREAMQAAGLPKDAAVGGADAMRYYQLPPHHLSVEEIDANCMMFPNYSSERARKREAAQTKAICKMMKGNTKQTGFDPSLVEECP